MKSETAQNLISKTRDDYNKVSTHFASTRKYNWPDITEAVATLGKIADNAKILDIGCGAGRVSELFPSMSEYIGIDLSPELVKIALATYPDRKFLEGDVTKLPFDDNHFDITISVATLHHIPSSALRKKAFKEIFRVTKPGGKLILTVWYFWNFSNIRYLFAKGTERIGAKDFLMPWKRSSGNIAVKRYFHAWTKPELRKMIRSSGFTKVKFFVAVRKQKRNLIATAQKPAK